MYECIHFNNYRLKIPGQIGGINFKSMGARYILVVEKGINTT